MLRLKWIAAVVAILAGVIALRMTQAEPPRTAAPQTVVSAAPSPTAAVVPMPKAAPEEPDEPNPFIRIRRPDGTTTVIEETDEVRQRRSDEMDEARSLSERESLRLKAEFLETLEKQGAQAAVQLLAPLLRSPKRTVEDNARVFEAIRLAVEVQKDLGQNPGTSVYEAARATATAQLASFLTDERVGTYPQSLALSRLAGLSVSVSVRGPRGVLVDGLLTYDSAEPPEVLPCALPARPADVKEWASGKNPALGEPVLVEACWTVARDLGIPDYLRAEALRLLGTRSESLNALDLTVAFADPSAHVREAVIDLLALRPGGVPPGTFFSLLEAEPETHVREMLFERLSESAFGSPLMVDVLRKSLPVEPAEGDRNFEDAHFRVSVLKLTLQHYSPGNDALRDLLAERLRDWSRIQWLAVECPVVTLADQAAAGGWKEFAPHLQVVIPQLPSASDQEKVRAALSRLE